MSIEHTVPGVREVFVDGYIVDPGFEGRVEELEPFLAHMEDGGPAQEEMFVPETGGHPTKVKQVPVKNPTVRFSVVHNVYILFTTFHKIVYLVRYYRFFTEQY